MHVSTNVDITPDFILIDHSDMDYGYSTNGMTNDNIRVCPNE